MIFNRCLTMTKFYKERHRLFRLCRVCGVEFRSPKRIEPGHKFLCIVHRREFNKQQGLKYPGILWKDRSPEYKAKAYQRYLLWVKNNLEWRRTIARISSQRRKYSGKRYEKRMENERNRILRQKQNKKYRKLILRVRNRLNYQARKERRTRVREVTVV